MPGTFMQEFSKNIELQEVHKMLPKHVRPTTDDRVDTKDWKDSPQSKLREIEL